MKVDLPGAVRPGQAVAAARENVVVTSSKRTFDAVPHADIAD